MIDEQFDDLNFKDPALKKLKDNDFKRRRIIMDGSTTRLLNEIDYLKNKGEKQRQLVDELVEELELLTDQEGPGGPYSMALESYRKARGK